jgi:hypothetical protein
MPEIEEVADASVAVVHREKMGPPPHQPRRLLEIVPSQLRASRRSGLSLRNQIQRGILADSVENRLDEYGIYLLVG